MTRKNVRVKFHFEPSKAQLKFWQRSQGDCCFGRPCIFVYYVVQGWRTNVQHIIQHAELCRENHSCARYGRACVLCQNQQMANVNQLLNCLCPPCVADADIIFLPCGFFFFLFLLFFFLRLISAVAEWMSTILSSTHGVALARIQNAALKCAAHGSLKIQDAKKSPKIRHQHTIAQLCRAISSQRRHVSTIEKKLVKQQQNNSSTIL